MPKLTNQQALKKIALAGSESIEAIIKFKTAETAYDRLLAFGGLGDDVLNLVTLDWKGARDEWRARTPETFTLLMDEIRKEFEIPNKELEVKIEDTIESTLFVIEEIAALIDRWGWSALPFKKAS